jgi:predicted  nucleic acid-binding Zn-ribbon protein
MLPMPVWMEQTERVIESYKGEVDTLRKQVRTYGRALTALLDDIAELKKLRKELQALLEGDK